MFAFLEREGAHGVVDSVGNWVMYLLHQAKANALLRKRLDAPILALIGGKSVGCCAMNCATRRSEFPSCSVNASGRISTIACQGSWRHSATEKE